MVVGESISQLVNFLDTFNFPYLSTPVIMTIASTSTMASTIKYDAKKGVLKMRTDSGSMNIVIASARDSLLITCLEPRSQKYLRSDSTISSSHFPKQAAS